MSQIQLFKFIFFLIPISSLALAAQATLTFLNPQHELSRQFLEVAPDLFVFELVWMHSSVFWLGRKEMVTGKLAEFFFAIFLFGGYALFIIPMLQKNEYLVWNYTVLNILRLICADAEPWYADTDFYKIGIKPSDRKFVTSMGVLFKLCFYALVLPTIAVFLPAPKTGLTLENAQILLRKSRDVGGLIMTTKSLFLYFVSMVLFDLWLLKRQLFKKKSNV